MKRTVFSIHPLIRNTLLIVPLLLVITVYFLREGISVDSLNIGQFKVDGLYLKLDKKLVLKVHYLSLPKKRKQQDYSQLEAVADRIKWLPKYFQSVLLDRVNIDGSFYKVIYKDNVIYAGSQDYEIAGMIERKGNIIEGEFPLLIVKKYDLRMHGRFQYQYQKDILAVDANFTIDGINGHLLAKNKGDKTSFRLSTDRFGYPSMKKILDLLDADKDTKEWLGGRIHAQNYRIDSFEGIILKQKHAYHLEPMSASLKARVDNASVRFEDKLEKLMIDTAELSLEKNVLYVNARNPEYIGKSLKGTKFYLTNLLGPRPSKIHLNVKTNTIYDKNIEKLLKAYGVSLPLIQRKGTIVANVILDIMARSGKTAFRGGVKLGRGDFDLYGVPLKVFGGKVDFDDRKIVIEHLDADTGWLKSTINGKLDLNKKRAAFRLDIKRLVFGDRKSPFLSMKNKHKVPVKLDWKKNFKIDIPLYKTSVAFASKKGFSVVCSDIKPLLPYLGGVPVSLSGGSIKIKTKDSRHYSFFGKVFWPSSYLYGKKGTIKTFPVNGTFSDRSSTLSALGGKIRYNSAKSLIELKNLYIDAKKMLGSTRKHAGTQSKIHVKGYNSLIRYDKYVLLTDTFDLRINGKHTLFGAVRDGDTVRVEINGDAIVVKADRIKAPMLRALIHFGGLNGGRYSLDLHGRMNGVMKGVITVQGGVASSFKTYNNLIALFNTVPALSTLSDPGFSKKGFEIRTGRIEFRIVKNRVFFDMIYIDGKSAAISGKGTVSLLNGAIDMDLAVRTARGIGKIIGSIPIVGYILMGKDKSITTGVKVTGTLDNPRVTTHVVMETLLAPFEMFVRTIKSPAHIINN